jgi:hypothetical protein
MIVINISRIAAFGTPPASQTGHSGAGRLHERASATYAAVESGSFVELEAL